MGEIIWDNKQDSFFTGCWFHRIEHFVTRVILNNSIQGYINVFTVTLFRQRSRWRVNLFGIIKFKLSYRYDKATRTTALVRWFCEEMSAVSLRHVQLFLKCALYRVPHDWKKHCRKVGRRWRMSVSKIYVTYFLWRFSQTDG
jgi:hypothetical protein